MQEIYYGAYQKGVAQTPVVRLTGLLEIQNWVRCMDQFDKDGDYSVFVPLLKKDQVQGHQLLGEAAFLERVGNLSLAKQKLGSFWDKQPHAHSPAGQMFLPLLKERLNWRLTLRRSAWEQTLATQALNRKDYLRACIMAYEARLSHQVEQTGGDINNFTHRDQASKTLENASDGRNHKAPDNFFTLKNLRNQLAHGVRAHSAASSLRAQESTNFIAAMACDETKLHTWLSQVLKQTL
ncbi:MAG: hypothetical protein LWW92_13300 [Rhodocyclales bacterium]|nr:hypothetical protein [Rhodocyclales bacterium]